MDYEYRNILKEPPNLQELNELATKGEFTVVDLLNPKSKAGKDMKVDLKKTTTQEAVQLIRQNPRMMKRPIFFTGEAVVVGFQEQQLSSLILQGE